MKRHINKEIEVYRGHEDEIHSVISIDTHAGTCLVSWSRDERPWDFTDEKYYDKTIRIWDPTGKEIAVCRGHEDGVNSVIGVNTEDGMRLVSCSDDFTMRIWDLTGKERAVCAGHGGWVLSVISIDTKY